VWARVLYFMREPLRVEVAFRQLDVCAGLWKVWERGFQLLQPSFEGQQLVAPAIAPRRRERGGRPEQSIAVSFCKSKFTRSALAPVVAGVSLVFKDLVEGFGLLDEDVGGEVRLVKEDGPEADELEHGEEHADDGGLGVGVAKEFAEGDGAVLHEQAAFDVVDHLGDGDGVLIDVEDGALAQTIEDVAKDADEVDGVGSDLLFHIERGIGGAFSGRGLEIT